MPREAAVFDQNALEYDEWFDEHANLYQSELAALKKAIPEEGKGIEIGVGSGRFAEPLSVDYGVEPADHMAKLAESRVVAIYEGYAENLPLENSSFDFALMVTTVCFLSDIPKAFAEVYRILKQKGILVIGLIEQNSQLGKQIESKKGQVKFYQDAHLHTTEEVTNALSKAGFASFSYWQTLFDLSREQVEAPQKGHDKGSFIVIKTQKA